MENPTESLLDDTTVIDKGDGGNQTTDVTDPKPAIWQEQLSADLKGHELLSGIENVNDLGAKHVELAGKLDGAIFKPGEGASDEAVKAYQTAMDIPETAEGYEIKRPDLPDGLDYDDAMEAEALKVFHASGMSRESAQMAMDFYNNMVIEAYKQMETDAETAKTDTKAALEKDWGDAMKPNVQGAEQVMERFDKYDLRLRLEEKGLSFDPSLYRFLHDIRKVMSDDTLMPPAEGTAGDGNMERTADGGPALAFKDMPTQ